jgi:hypothetical protein
MFLRLPHALRELRPAAPLPYRLPPRFGIIPFIRRDDSKALAGTASSAGVPLDGLKQRYALGPLIPVGWRSAVRERHPAPVRQAVAQEALALPPVGAARAAPLARGKKRRQWRRTPTEACLLPRPRPASVLAWGPRCHPPATAAPRGRHTTGPQ